MSKNNFFKTKNIIGISLIVGTYFFFKNFYKKQLEFKKVNLPDLDIEEKTEEQKIKQRRLATELAIINDSRGNMWLSGTKFNPDDIEITPEFKEAMSDFDFDFDIRNTIAQNMKK